MNKASLANHPEFVKHTIENDASTKTQTDVEDKLAATYFLTFADPTRFSGLWKDLHNSTLLGRDEYPSSITMAYDLLNHYRGKQKQSNRFMDTHVSFAQVKLDSVDLVAGTDGNTHNDVTCFKCMKPRHIARHYPS